MKELMTMYRVEWKSEYAPKGVYQKDLYTMEALKSYINNNLKDTEVAAYKIEVYANDRDEIGYRQEYLPKSKYAEG